MRKKEEEGERMAGASPCIPSITPQVSVSHTSQG